MRHIVNFSGGIGSWATAKRVADKFGPNDVTLLFADTMMEDEDLYRFLRQSAQQIGAELVEIRDGRNVWDVFKDGHTIGNGKIDICSRVLKRTLMDKWRNENCDPVDTIVYVGLDWTESHRFTSMQAALIEKKSPWKFEAPLIAPPHRTKNELLSELAQFGIDPPRLYSMGFAHNNCGGFCVKAGHQHFKLLLEKLPERYAWHEKQEEETREIQRQHGIVPSSVLYHRRGVKKGRIRITMKEFREMAEKSPTILHNDDLAQGCGCAIDL